MPYTTASGTSDAEAQEYAETALPAVKAEAVLRDAERIVSSIATLGDGSAEYKRDAKDAELRVFETLTTDERTKSAEVGNVSVSYFEPGGDGYERVRQTLWRWISAAERDSDSAVAYISGVPW